MGYEWDFGVVLRDFDLLLWGLLNTLKVTVAALAFGVPLGLGRRRSPGCRSTG